MKTIYRHEIPIDDQPHLIEAFGGISATGAILFKGLNGYYEVWAENDPELNREISFQVYGTGHEIPDNSIYWSTSLRHSTGLVFHLYEVNAY